MASLRPHQHKNTIIIHCNQIIEEDTHFIHKNKTPLHIEFCTLTCCIQNILGKINKKYNYSAFIFTFGNNKKNIQRLYD